MGAAEWIAVGALVVSMIAAVFGGLSWWAANRSANAADKSSETAREQVAIMRVQTEIQRGQLEEARRANRLVGRSPGTQTFSKMQGGELASRPPVPTPKPSPRFSITHDSRQGYVIANAGGATAYDVEFDYGNLLWRPRNSWPTEWESSHAEYVVIARAWGSDPLVRVSYATEPGGDKRSQTLTVPRGE